MVAFSIGPRSVPSITRAPVKAVVEAGCCAGVVADRTAAAAQPTRSGCRFHGDTIIVRVSGLHSASCCRCVVSRATLRCISPSLLLCVIPLPPSPAASAAARRARCFGRAEDAPSGKPQASLHRPITWRKSAAFALKPAISTVDCPLGSGCADPGARATRRTPDRPGRRPSRAATHGSAPARDRFGDAFVARQAISRACPDARGRGARRPRT